MTTGIVPFQAIAQDKTHRLDAKYWLKECCVVCGRFIDGEVVKFGVKVDDGTGKMCLDCYDKQLEKV